MKENKLKNIHPGEVLLEDFLKPMDLSQYELAVQADLSHSSITRIIQGKQAVTPETAIKLATFFGNNPRFWLGLQMDFDIEELQRKKSKLFSSKSLILAGKKARRQKSLITK